MHYEYNNSILFSLYQSYIHLKNMIFVTVKIVLLTVKINTNSIDRTININNG